MKAFAWRNVILDEAQAIKNPGAKQTKAIKAMQSSWRLALTGTPVKRAASTAMRSSASSSCAVKTKAASARSSN
ncbi:MAG: SNF2-related protein [Pseudomonadota bacterium]